jgi:DNA-binding NarL/FixJ family response regulator
MQTPSPPENERPVVLVVDDAPSSLGMLCDTLESSGYTVLVAADGEAALQRLELVVPDAILLDGMMPGLSGFETCRRIKANAALAHIPVLFMTGLSETAHVVEGFECGGVDYVVKPIRAQEVLARLHTHTRNARITRMARDAVDVAGMGVVFVDAHGRVAWRSPQAALWLHAMDVPPTPGLLPASLGPVLAPGAAIAVMTTAGTRLSVRNLGAAALGETMLLFAVQREGAGGAPSARLAEAALTPRETEVLSWLAKGKTNRDIGEILGSSPATAKKHLERVYVKLGVETRTAAAGVAIKRIRELQPQFEL